MTARVFMAGAALGLVLARSAAAREGEVEIALSPAVGVTHRHEQWRRGPSMGLGVRYGVEPYDWFAVEGVVHWDQIGALEESVGPRGSRFYDARRVGATASVLARRGNRVVWVTGAGIGYRYESRRDEIALAAPVERKASAEPRHRLVASLTGSLQWRIVDRFSAALWARVDAAALRGDIDGATGLSLGVHLWP